MAMLYLQRNGKIFRREKISGIVAYITMVAVLLAGGLMKGDSLLDDTPEFRMAEYVAAIIYSAMQFYYCWLNIMGSAACTAPSTTTTTTTRTTC